MFKSPQFEIKKNNEKDWEKVSEKDFLIELVDTFERVTPVLNDLIKGKEIITHYCIYRIRL